MKKEITRKDIYLGEVEEKILKKHCDKIEKLLSNFNPDLVFLRVYFDKVDRKKEFKVRGILELPAKTLRAEKSAKDFKSAIKEMFEALEREIKKYKELLRREPEYKRKRRPGYKEKLAEIDISKEIYETYSAFLERVYPLLYSFVIKEIRNLIYQGQIKPGEMAATEIVNEAIAKVGRSLKQNYNEKEVRQTLYKEIISIIRSKLEQKKVSTVPLEKRIAPDEIDSEFYDYYQPDEVLKIEDILPASPSQQRASDNELMDRIEHILSILPNQWRRAFTLVEIDGFSEEEVAMILDSTPPEIGKNIEMAKAFIRAKLKDAGMEWNK